MRTKTLTHRQFINTPAFENKTHQVSRALLSMSSMTTTPSLTPSSTSAPGLNSTPTHPLEIKSGINHATLVIIALAVSLSAVCLISVASFWLYRKPSRKPKRSMKSQERFDKAELDTREVSRKRSFKAELSAQTLRIPELVGVVELSELPATPLIRESKRKTMNFF
jgi:hypothetical protein